MKQYLRALAVTGFILVLGVVGLLPPAYAFQKLSLDDPTDLSAPIIVTDGGVGDINTAAGVITFSGVIGTFIINVTTSISKPVMGSASTPHLDLNSVNVSTPGPGTLTIMHTDTDFSSAGPSAGQMSLGGTTAGSVEYKAYYDLANSAFGLTTLIGTTGVISTTPFASAITGAGPGADPAYSLTQVVTIVHEGGGAQSSSFDAELTVPEPDASLLLGMSLAGLGLLGYGLRRRV